ncbi:hypothetical protein OSTOST_25579 [Ostertagia ostertagi]
MGGGGGDGDVEATTSVTTGEERPLFLSGIADDVIKKYYEITRDSTLSEDEMRDALMQWKRLLPPDSLIPFVSIPGPASSSIYAYISASPLPPQEISYAPVPPISQTTRNIYPIPPDSLTNSVATESSYREAYEEVQEERDQMLAMERSHHTEGIPSMDEVAKQTAELAQVS